MGLLDSLLSGGSGGGLLDFLRSNAMNQQFGSGLPSDQAQYGSLPMQGIAPQPQGLAPQSQGIPQQPPPVIQAQPMQAPQSMQQPAQQQGPGFGDHLMAGLQGFANSGGLLPAIANGIGGLATGQRTDPTGVAIQTQQQQRSAMFQALRASGFDQQTSMAAALNPEVGNKLLEQRAGQTPHTQEIDKDGNVWDVNSLTGQKTISLAAKDDKFQHITQKGGPLDGETSGTFNTKTGETKWDAGAPGVAPATGIAAMTDKINQMRDAGATREDLVKQIPPKYQGYVTSLLDGKATPVNMGRGQERAALIQIAHTIDPTFDETLIPARIQTAKDFTPQGKSGASIVAFNTVQHHIGKLSDDFEKLGEAGQGGFQAINAIRNGAASNTPFDIPRQKAVQAVNDDLKAVSDEMSAAYKAGHVSDTEIKSWNSLVNSNLPLTQARQAISDFVDLLNGKRDALNKVHQQIMGGDAAIIDKEENGMITQKVHTRNDGIAPSQTAQPDRSAIEAEMRRRGLMK